MGPTCLFTLSRAVTVAFHSVYSLCLCLSVTESLWLYQSVLLPAFGCLHSRLGFCQLKVNHISVDRNPQCDVSRQTRAITAIAFSQLTICLVHLGYPNRTVSRLGHIVCAVVLKMVIESCRLASDRSLGLYIRGIEEESRSRKEGLFQEDECIIRINNTDLMDKTFSQWVQHSLCGSEMPRKC